jgi:DNA primase
MTCSPFREESTASFSVSDDYREFYDFGNDEYKGDVFDFVRFATGCDTKEAFKVLAVMAGLAEGEAIIRVPVQKYHAKELNAVKPRHVPELTKPTCGELAELEARRSTSLYRADCFVRLHLTGTLHGY